MTNTATDITPASAAQAWVCAFNEHNVETLCALYDPEAVFWGTTSPTLTTTPAGVRDYFERTFETAPDASIQLQDPVVRQFGDVAVCAGPFTLTLTISGGSREFAARFSFTYRRSEGQWLIIDHHSSFAPLPP